jgi:hypothetical protein
MTHKFLLPLLIYGVLTACSSANANKDWANARTENTVAAYESYIDKHPSDEHAAWARKRIGTLLDDSAWQTAQSAKSVGSYLQYLEAEPYGTHAKAARDEIANLDRADEWHNAQSSGSKMALQAFLQRYPQGPEADQARQKLAALQGDYRADLGAFQDEGAAERKRAKLQSRFSSILKELDVVSPDSSSKAYRVMSGLMDRHEADSACASLKRDHQTCEVVKGDQGQI